MIELPLRRDRAPRLAGPVQGRDLVLVAIHVAGLHSHDERHRDAQIGRRRRHVRGRIRRVVGLEPLLARIGRLVHVAEAWRLIALLIACPLLTGPRLELRAGEHRPADPVIDQRYPRRPSAGQGRLQRVSSQLEPGHQALEGAVPASREDSRDIPATQRNLDMPSVRPRQVDCYQRRAAADQVSTAREDRDR